MINNISSSSSSLIFPAEPILIYKFAPRPMSPSQAISSSGCDWASLHFVHIKFFFRYENI